MKSLYKNLRANMETLHNMLPGMRLFYWLFLRNKILVLRWDDVKIYVSRSMMFIDPEFFAGFVCNHINKGKKCSATWGGMLPYALAEKYVKRLGLVSKVILTKNKNGELFIKNTYLGKENYVPYKGVLYNDCPERKVIQGINFNTYLCQSDDKIGVLKSFYDWLFKEFEIKNKVSGDIVDCHFLNFIMDNSGEFHFIDKDVTLNRPIDKSYVLYRSLCETGQLDLYDYFLKYYNIKDERERYKKNRLLPLPENNKNLKYAQQKNICLINSIFCE